MSELPEGWVECSVEECERVWNHIRGFMPIVGHSDNMFCICAASGSTTYASDWRAFGIIPVKKSPKPESVKIVDVAVLEASNDIENCLWCYAERSSDVFYIRDPFRLKPGMKVRVTIEEVIE